MLEYSRLFPNGFPISSALALAREDFRIAGEIIASFAGVLSVGLSPSPLMPAQSSDTFCSDSLTNQDLPPKFWKVDLQLYRQPTNTG